MKIYLDDERKAPDGWVLMSDVHSVIRTLKENTVTDLSLDHDLGKTDECGYDILLWIENEMHTKGYTPPRITIHTANPSARIKMTLAVESMKKYLDSHTCA